MFEDNTASLVFLELCSPSFEGANHEKNRARNAADEPYYTNSYFKRIRLLALALIFSEVICGAFLRSRWARGGVGYTPHELAIAVYAISACIGLVFLLISIRAKTTAEGALVIGTIGLAISALAAAFFSYLPMAVLHPIVTGLYSALLVYMMALIALWRLDDNHSVPVCACIFVALYCVSTTMTNTVIPLFLSFQYDMPEQYFLPIGITAGLIVSLGICSSLFLMLSVRRDSFEEALNVAGMPTGRPLAENVSVISDEDRRDETARALANRFGLTMRECDTALLLAKGYTVKRVAEELVVAPSTVQGYSKSIYRKLGIHQKNQLIEIVTQTQRNLDNLEPDDSVSSSSSTE